MTFKIRPSNFERRLYCPGSFRAEQHLPNVRSKYAEEGALLHEKTILQIEALENHIEIKFDDEINEKQASAVLKAAEYFQNLKKSHKVLYESHEKKRSLSFIHKDMDGTADSVLILNDIENNNVKLHIIDYKFGKGVAVHANKNYQLLLYYLSVVNDPDVKNIIDSKEITVHLHIVQPFIENTVWNLSEEERIDYSGTLFYKRVVEECFRIDAKRIPSKEACRFCKAKPTCPALSGTIPNLNVDVFDLTKEEVEKIYENKDLIEMYMKSVKEYINNKN